MLHFFAFLYITLLKYTFIGDKIIGIPFKRYYMIRKIFKRLSNLFSKATTVEEFNIDDLPYRVIDRTNALPFIKDTRDLSFLYEGRVYAQSSVYIEPDEVTQPAYTIVQEVINNWTALFDMQNALVLGCGGCTIPRYICRNFDGVKVIGVELSGKMIEIAKKHFTTPYMGKSFTLLQGDAIKYVNNYPLPYKQNLIFSDIFCINGVVPESFTQSYLNDLYNCTADNSVIIFNLLGTEFDEIIDFRNKITLGFDIKEILTNGNARFLLLARGTDKTSLKQFKERLSASDTFKLK